MRIFIALLFSEPNKQKIYEYGRQIEKVSDSGNFSTYNNLHLTLLFIGRTEVENVRKIADKLSEIKADKFEYQTGDIDFFKRSKLRKIVYLGLKDKYRLRQLYNRIIIKINEIGMDYSANRFTPHITLARQVVLNEEFDESLLHVEPLTLEADRISLMESKRVDGELVYSEIFSVPLK